MSHLTGLLRAASAVALAAALTVALPAAARFAEEPSIAGNTFSTPTLQPASGTGASPSCDGATGKITLTWTATESTFADGYDVYRGTAPGGPYSFVAHVTGRTTTGYDDTGLPLGATRSYVVQATAFNWTSADSTEASATTPSTC